MRAEIRKSLVIVIIVLSMLVVCDYTFADLPEGQEYFIADLNKDGYVTLADFAILASQWLQCTDPADDECD